MQEFAEALREFAPQHQSLEQAEAAAQELDEVRRRLDQQRKEQEDKLLKEQKGESMIKVQYGVVVVIDSKHWSRRVSRVCDQSTVGGCCNR